MRKRSQLVITGAGEGYPALRFPPVKPTPMPAPAKPVLHSYLVEATGYFGRPFRYTVQAGSRAEAFTKGCALLEEEFEYQSGNIATNTHGNMRVVKKLQR